MLLFPESTTYDLLSNLTHIPMNTRLTSFLALVLTLLLVSCGGGYPPMQRDYADAVTNINQVDPYYRPYFRSQNASNYTLADQRRAYLAAMQTARTPVRSIDYRKIERSRLASRSTRKAYSRRGAVASRKAAKGKKKISSRRGVAKRSTKSAKRGRATASRRSTARRGRRRG